MKDIAGLLGFFFGDIKSKRFNITELKKAILKEIRANIRVLKEIILRIEDLKLKVEKREYLIPNTLHFSFLHLQTSNMKKAIDQGHYVDLFESDEAHKIMKNFLTFSEPEVEKILNEVISTNIIPINNGGQKIQRPNPSVAGGHFDEFRYADSFRMDLLNHLSNFITMITNQIVSLKSLEEKEKWPNL